ncbi:MAG: DUF3179 domain-containing protein [Elusimicrobia bacterium]|nr:DUF3179 domain-containing protein [Elusimicrobiota bacterium]
MRNTVTVALTAALPLALTALTLGGCAGLDPEAALANRGRDRRPISVDHGKVFQAGGRRWLWGGKAAAQNFDITESRLRPAQLHYGIGREAFPALLEPRFEPVSSASKRLEAGERVLTATIAGETRIYPLSLLERHEVVNDELGGREIFAAFCPLADLAAVYDRRVHGRVHTFALSGYTYFSPELWSGLDAFVLWDRETESLWLPTAGRAVSGAMLDAPMTVLERSLWSQTTWGDARARFPDARVLSRDQPYSPPRTWVRLEPRAHERPTETPPDALAPRWGENGGVK